MSQEPRKSHRRRPALAVAALVTATILLGACSSDGNSTSSGTTIGATATATSVAPGSTVAGRAETVKVKLANFAFDPPSVEIPAGSTVEWTNDDTAPHTATSTEAPKSFDSGDLAKGQSYSETFTEPGTYKYYCSIHNYMTGTITVD